MAFVTVEHLRLSLAYLAAETHPLLISLFAATHSAMGVGDAGAVRLGKPQENAFLAKYSSPEGAPAERPFYVPFGDAQGKSRWRDTAYSGSSLQTQRKQRPEVLRQRTGDNKFWSFAPDAVAAMQAAPARFIGTAPVNLVHVGVWLFRSEPLQSLSELGARVVERFSVPQSWLDAGLFTLAVPPELESLPLVDDPPSSADVLSVLQASPPEPPVTQPSGEWSSLISAEIDLEGLVGMERPVRRAIAALKSGMHVVFTGAPGTGKTSLAVAILERVGLPYTIAPATDAWTTFETIGGYFPTPGDGAEERLDFLPGVVVASIEDQRCLIIDELNRADIDKAFGELFTLLAGAPVSLPYRRRSGDKFRKLRLSWTNDADDDSLDEIVVPPDWRIIGTMNDADKASLKRLSLAFVRRFAFVPVEVPGSVDYTAILDNARAKFATSDALTKVRDALVTLFATESGGLKAIGFPVGPAVPLTMLTHAASELALSSDQTSDDLLASAVALYLAPQLQGRPDLHQKVVSTVAPLIGPDNIASFDSTLAVWTGYA